MGPAKRRLWRETGRWKKRKIKSIISVSGLPAVALCSVALAAKGKLTPIVSTLF